METLVMLLMLCNQVNGPACSIDYVNSRGIADRSSYYQVRVSGKGGQCFDISEDYDGKIIIKPCELNNLGL